MLAASSEILFAPGSLQTLLERAESSGFRTDFSIAWFLFSFPSCFSPLPPPRPGFSPQLTVFAYPPPNMFNVILFF